MSVCLIVCSVSIGSLAPTRDDCPPGTGPCVNGVCQNSFQVEEFFPPAGGNSSGNPPQGPPSPFRTRSDWNFSDPPEISVLHRRQQIGSVRACPGGVRIRTVRNFRIWSEPFAGPLPSGGTTPGEAPAPSGGGTDWPHGNGNCVGHVCGTSGPVPGDWINSTAYWRHIHRTWKSVDCENATDGCLEFILRAHFKKTNGRWQFVAIADAYHVALITADGKWNHKPGYNPSKVESPSVARPAMMRSAIPSDSAEEWGPEMIPGTDVFMTPSDQGQPDGSMAVGILVRCYCP